MSNVNLLFSRGRPDKKTGLQRRREQAKRKNRPLKIKKRKKHQLTRKNVEVLREVENVVSTICSCCYLSPAFRAFWRAEFSFLPTGRAGSALQCLDLSLPMILPPGGSPKHPVPTSSTPVVWRVVVLRIQAAQAVTKRLSRRISCHRLSQTCCSSCCAARGTLRTGCLCVSHCALLWAGWGMKANSFP